VENWVYFQTSIECSGGFWFVCSYILTSGIGHVRSSGCQTFLTDTWHGNMNFRRVNYFRFLSSFRFRNRATELRPSRAHDLVTMADVGSMRLVSLERVTMGVESVSRGARAKPNSLGRSLWLPLPDGAVSMTFCPNSLFTDNRKMSGNSGNDLRYKQMQCMLQYNAENSVTDRLVRQLKRIKVVSIYLLDQCSSASTIAARARSWLRSALGTEEFPRRDKFCDSNERRVHEGYRKILPTIAPVLKMSNMMLSKHFARRKWRFSTFTKSISHRTMKLWLQAIPATFAYWFAVKIMSLRRF